MDGDFENTAVEYEMVYNFSWRTDVFHEHCDAQNIANAELFRTKN
jgi:hypothetical protein